MFYSRLISGLIGVCLIVLLLTYRSFETTFVFYLSWLAGLFSAALFISIGFFKVKIDRITTTLLTIVGVWVAVGLFFSPFAYDINEHLKILTVTTFYMLTSVFFSEFLIKSRLPFHQYTFIMLNIWALVNFILLFLFLIGVYVPSKGDFSGVFHDRNVFSITTLLVLGFSLSHLGSLHNKISRFILYFSLISCVSMIVISKSLTGLVGLIFLMFLYSQRYSFFKRFFLYGAGCLLLAFIIMTDNPISIRVSRFALVLMGDTDLLHTNESAYLRMYLLKGGFELAMQNPWFGIGLNNAKEFVIWPDRDYGSFLHNTYLDILTSGGFPLFLVYYGPIFYCLFSLISLRKKVLRILDERYYSLWKLAFVSLSLKLICDLTWTTYFEYFMVFTVMFSMYITFYIKRALRVRIKYRAFV